MMKERLTSAMGQHSTPGGYGIIDKLQAGRYTPNNLLVLLISSLSGKSREMWHGMTYITVPDFKGVVYEAVWEPRSDQSPLSCISHA